MAIVDLIMPKLGESITEATILKWHKQPGDAVKEDETVLEIATDKVDTEVPSTTSGVIEELLFKVNDVVPIGSAIARIKTGNGQIEHQEKVVTNSAVPANATASFPEKQGNLAVKGGTRFYSPLVLNIAANEGIGLAELELIPGTGNEGRVTKQDILLYLSHKSQDGHMRSNDQPNQQSLKHQTFSVPEKFLEKFSDSQQSESSTQMATGSGNVEIIEMDRMRKLIAGHMVQSKRTSAHVTSFAESDVTNLVQWRDRIKKEFEKRESTKITLTPLFIEALIKCIKKYPLINSSVEGEKIILKKDIHIGMATALPTGNLIVPVIRNADQLNLVGLTRQVNQLAENARNGKLRPDDTQGGTFTFTNVGTFGSLMGTPIINQPQVAILAVGAIKKRPVVIETAQGDSIAIRHMMYLSLSYDHRIIDGSLGATFLTAVANELQNFDLERDF
jgi:2-oxoglutarate dehydrogenase E2 component (dihydrolipoamide succinyltransferase)